MTISQRLTRAALAFLLFGLVASLLPSSGLTMASAAVCTNGQTSPSSGRH